MKIIKKTKLKSLDELRAWAKENSFIYPSSEIYGGFQAVYDYGHYGYLLKENIKKSWEKSLFQERDDVIGLDSGIFMHPKTWEASGHVGGFSDVLIEDKKTHKRYRADHLIEDWMRDNSDFKVRFEEEINKLDNKRIVDSLKNEDVDKLTPEEMTSIIKLFGVKSPEGNELANARNFNLLVKSNLGTTDSSFNEENVSYLRGETCQGIYLNFKNVVDNMRVKIPFGIAQVGKAFRNEIIARQYIFRTREFEQMEMQYFIHPEMNETKFNEWKEERISWYKNILGIESSELKFKAHEKLVFYAKAAEDIVYNFKSMGKFDEIEGIHARSDYDLSQHQKFSGVKHEYFDQEKNQKYIPWIIEASCGLNRLTMMLLDNSWTRETFEDGSERVVLNIKSSMAPIKVAVLPLMKKDGLAERAKEIKQSLSKMFMCEYDQSGSIGKRYRRQDEIGTPLCVTIDYTTLESNVVTVRDRDTMEQEIVKIDELSDFIKNRLHL